ncbi:MAG TPA: alpha-amylase family glycosyl hydrolase, partial [Chitinophagaceae bacterium]|nr:alpha-amylase family glycosyl hydrolase [Chitinophagaceae bacterium]
MYNYSLHQQIHSILSNRKTDQPQQDPLFETRFVANASAIESLYASLYGHHPHSKQMFTQLLQLVADANSQRSVALQQRDRNKEKEQHWFLSNHITGMSLYTDRFCGNLRNLAGKLSYFKKLGVNFLHLMPLFESPPGESDGGYAVSDFKKVDERFGTLNDLISLQQQMHQ